PSPMLAFSSEPRGRFAARALPLHDALRIWWTASFRPAAATGGHAVPARGVVDARTDPVRPDLELSRRGRPHRQAAGGARGGRGGDRKSPRLKSRHVKTSEHVSRPHITTL